MSDRQLNPYAALDLLRADVEILRRANPEMTDDEKLFADMVEGSTNFDDLVHKFLQQYFDKNAIVDRLRERADMIERQRDAWKAYIKKARVIAHITEKQTFPEGTIFESKRPDELIFDPDQVPDEYKKVDRVELRKALKNKVTTYARLVPSNEPPTLVIRTK